jgi:hypothetical protein
MPIQVNVTTKVNSKQIRRETHNGREHIVIPSKTLPFGVVMNGGLYPRDQIESNYQKLDGTLAPLGHPTVNGQFVSAFSPEGINIGHIGAWNRNARIEGNRVYVEKWVDVEFAKNTAGGRDLLERVSALERGEDVQPIHTSVAVFLEKLEANESQRTAGAEWVANIKGMDHDAILLHDVGAATPEQGVGLMVNADQAQALQANTGALVGESYREREARIEAAAKAKFATGKDDYAWVADFTDTQAVIVVGGGQAQLYGYKTEGGKVVFDDAGTPVKRMESWMAITANSFWKRFFNPQARPASTKEGNMPFTVEEKAELTQEISKAVTTNIGQVVADAIKPVTDSVQAVTKSVDGLQANQKALADQITAKDRAAEADKRKAVAAQFGDVVANSLSGEALDAMHAKLGTATELAANASASGKDSGLLVADVNNLPKE